MKVKILKPVHGDARRGKSRASMYPAGHLGVSHGEKLEAPGGLYEVDDEYGAQLVAEGKAERV